MLPLMTGPERKKYLAELEKNKNLDSYRLSALAGLKLRKLKRKEPAAKSGAGTGEVEIEDLDGTGDEVAFVQGDSPQTKKVKPGNYVDYERSRPSASRDVGGLSLMVEAVEATDSFWHSEFDFRKYMSEHVPFAKVDIEAGVKAKFSELVADAGSAALGILLMSHAVELKHGKVEKQFKDAAEDVEKWKHIALGCEVLLKDTLKEKKAAEKELHDMKQAKEAAQKERDSRREEVDRLQKALEEANSAVKDGRRALAVYFQNRWMSSIYSKSL